jgi:hypothetical protein
MRDQRHCVQRTGRRDQRHVPEHGVVALTIGRVARPRGGVSRPIPADTQHVWSALLEVPNVPFEAGNGRTTAEWLKSSRACT